RQHRAEDHATPLRPAAIDINAEPAPVRCLAAIEPNPWQNGGLFQIGRDRPAPELHLLALGKVIGQGTPAARKQPVSHPASATPRARTLREIQSLSTHWHYARRTA